MIECIDFITEVHGEREGRHHGEHKLRSKIFHVTGGEGEGGRETLPRMIAKGPPRGQFATPRAVSTLIYERLLPRAARAYFPCKVKGEHARAREIECEMRKREREREGIL